MYRRRRGGQKSSVEVAKLKRGDMSNRKHGIKGGGIGTCDMVYPSSIWAKRDMIHGLIHFGNYAYLAEQ